MHLFNSNSMLPLKGESVHVMCPHPEYKTELPHHEVGQMFLGYYLHDLVASLVEFYLQCRYQGDKNLIPLYADINDNLCAYFDSDMNFAACNLFDEAAIAQDTHPTWAETVLSYFNHDSLLIGEAVLDVLGSVHEVIFFPVMNMIEVCCKAGLTLLPDEHVNTINGIDVLMRIGQDEFTYDRYNDESYANAPFRTGNPTVRTIGEIGRNVYGCGPLPIHPLVYTNPINISGYAGYGGRDDRFLGTPLLV